MYVYTNKNVERERRKIAVTWMYLKVFSKYKLIIWQSFHNSKQSHSLYLWDLLNNNKTEWKAFVLYFTTHKSHLIDRELFRFHSPRGITPVGTNTATDHNGNKNKCSSLVIRKAISVPFAEWHGNPVTRFPWPQLCPGNRHRYGYKL